MENKSVQAFGGRRQWLKTGSLALAGSVLHWPARLLAKEPLFNAVADELSFPIALHRNENPYGFSPLAAQAIRENIGFGNRYAISQRDTLKKALSDKFHISTAQVFITSGSQEVLGLSALFASRSKGNIVVPDPSYGVVATYGATLGMEIRKVPLDDNRRIDLAAMNRAIDSNTRLVYICNPNGPTGTILKTGELSAFCREVSRRTIVLVDEAYLEFVTEDDNVSMATLVSEHQNILVSKTFSKLYGMAGLRVGYLIAHPDTIKTVSPFHMAVGMAPCGTSTAAATACLRDEMFYAQALQQIKRSYRYTAEQLTAMKIPFVPSHGNFVYVRTDGYNGNITADMETKGILLGTPQTDKEGNWIRLTMGKPGEMIYFFDQVKKNWI